MSESTQHKLNRVRSPRVQITYDVETGGAAEKKEIPFIVGILAPLSGKSEKSSLNFIQSSLFGVNISKLLTAIPPN